MPHLPQLDGSDDLPRPVRKRPNLALLKTNTTSANSEDSADSDYISPTPRKKPTPNVAANKLPKKAAHKVLEQVKSDDKRDRRLLSTDVDEEDEAKPKRNDKAVDIWVEVYSEAEEQWMAVDLFKKKVHCIDAIRVSILRGIGWLLKPISNIFGLFWFTSSKQDKPFLGLKKKYLNLRNGCRWKMFG